MTMNKMYVTHIFICFMYFKILESVILVYGMSTILEDTDGCANQYRCDLVVYLMDVLSSLYIIITYHQINSPGRVNIVVD